MTSGKEDYLKAIYLISESHELVTNKELSNMLHVSPPSVSEMITKSQKQGYVDYTAYKGKKMTRKGRREAGRLFALSFSVGSVPRRETGFLLERGA